MKNILQLLVVVALITASGCSSKNEDNQELSQAQKDSAEYFNKNNMVDGDSNSTKNEHKEPDLVETKKILTGKWIFSNKGILDKEEEKNYQKYLTHCKQQEWPEILADTLIFTENNTYERAQQKELDQGRLRNAEYIWQKEEVKKDAYKKTKGAYEITDIRNLVLHPHTKPGFDDDYLKIKSISSDTLILIDSIFYPKHLAIYKAFYKRSE